MGKILKKIGIISSLASRYIGIIIIAFSCLAFFWRDGFSWMTNYTSVFLGVIMFGMGLTIKLDDFRAIFSRPKEVVIGAVAQYTIMPVIAWLLCKVMNLPADLALGVILVGCCPGGTASNVITYIAGGDVALSVGMTIVSTLAAPLMTPFLVYVLAGAWVEVSFWAMVISVVKVILIPVLGQRNRSSLNLIGITEISKLRRVRKLPEYIQSGHAILQMCYPVCLSICIRCTSHQA